MVLTKAGIGKWWMAGPGKEWSMSEEYKIKRLRQFLGMSSALVLNVAGPRESKAPGIQARAKAFLEELLWEA